MDQVLNSGRRTRVVRLVGAIAAAVAIGIGGAVSAAPAWASESGTIYARVNADRAANGLGALSANGSLAAVAQNWAQQMAAAGVMSHNPNVASQVPAGWSRVGENVAHGFASGAATEAGWMASPGHRANILGDYTAVGVGWVVDAAGSTWAVQVFAKYGGSVAPPRAAAPPAPAPAAPVVKPPAAKAPVAKAPVAAAPAPAAPAPAPVVKPAPKATLRTQPGTPRGDASMSTRAASQAAPMPELAGARRAAAVGPADSSWRGWLWLVGPLSVVLLTGAGGLLLRRRAA